MTTFQTRVSTPPIPHNLSIPQFFLDSAIHREPLEPWFIEDATGRSITLPETRTRTSGLANALRSRFSISYDDVVLIFSRNHVDYPIVIWATHRLGGIITGANPDFSANELIYQLQTSKATLIMAHPDALETTRAAAELCGFPTERIILLNMNTPSNHSYLTVDDLVKEGLSKPFAFTEPKIDPRNKLAFLSYSSGTTGKPKAVAIPHISVITNVLQMHAHHKVDQNYTTWEERRFRAGDVAIAVLPFYHIYGLVLNLHFMLYSGITLVVIPKFNFVEMLKSISHYRINHLMLVPPQVVLLCKHPAVKSYNLSSVRSIMVGAAPLSNEINHQLFQLFPNAHIGQAYGMTETCTATTCWPIEKQRGASGCAGRLMPGVKMRIMKPDGTLAGFNEPGELVVYSPSNALGYYNNPEATKETFLDGWVRTGDEAKVDENMEIWVLDRIKEIMKVRGFQVAPAEIEGCILDHTDVSDTCVVGVPDDFSDEVPMAFVVPTAEAAKRMKEVPNTPDKIKESIMKHVEDNKVSYKKLAGGVEFVKVIPKNPSGKLLRRVLRERAKEIHKSRTLKAKL
ncbi:phenylacetyl- ligase [Moniliophthora roreri MCA 2997]|uniref:Phenylacetyl-ligase n=1 Tax=Moniliophthora roreri (strain MCA 2997) TaxID=1381753 RepID=V2XQ02_MONRO|nr:phenylacetyl- ligase [Moniliophthora roreri MCA 2997]